MNRTITDSQRSTILDALRNAAPVLKQHARRLEEQAGTTKDAVTSSLQMATANTLQEQAADMDELYEELL